MIFIIISVLIVALTFGYFKFATKSCPEYFKGKLALVTGGANGLGQQICIKLAQLGCNIAVVDIDFTSAKATAEKLIEFGVSSKAYKVDVSNFSEIVKLKAEILADLGEVDVLINNAGIIAYKTIFDQSAEEIERLTNVNFNAVIYMTKCFMENMIRRKTGHIVTISSLQGVYAFPHSVAYCATKFGCFGFMAALKEFIRMKKLDNFIHTTTILPDVIATRNDLVEIVNPKFHLLSPEEVAQATVDAISTKTSVASVPSSLHFGIKLFNVLPFFAQHFIRDNCRNESTFLLPK